MATDDASVLTPHLIPVDHATRRPCPPMASRSDVRSVHPLWVSEWSDPWGVAGAAARDRMRPGVPLPHDPSPSVRDAPAGGAQRCASGRRACPARALIASTDASRRGIPSVRNVHSHRRAEGRCVAGTSTEKAAGWTPSP
jgi:hypothetical protein